MIEIAGDLRRITLMPDGLRRSTPSPPHSPRLQSSRYRHVPAAATDWVVYPAARGIEYTVGVHHDPLPRLVVAEHQVRSHTSYEAVSSTARHGHSGMSDQALSGGGARAARTLRGALCLRLTVEYVRAPGGGADLDKIPTAACAKRGVALIGNEREVAQPRVVRGRAPRKLGLPITRSTATR